MRQYTIKVDNGNGIENIWTGDSLSRAHHYEEVADNELGPNAMIWIYDNVNKVEVESYTYIKSQFESNSLYVS